MSDLGPLKVLEESIRPTQCSHFFFLTSCHYNVLFVMRMRIVATAPISYVMSVRIISAARTGRIRVKFNIGGCH